MNDPKIHPYIPIFIGVLSVSMSAIFVKLAQSDSELIAFYRMFFSIIIMLPLFLWKYIHEIKKLSKRDWLFSSIAGIFLAFHFILWFESLNYTSVASSTVLVTLQPLFAFVGTALFFKEKITLKTLIAGLVAIFGSVLISWGDFGISEEALFGDILALIACALVTAYLLFGQDVRKRLSLITYTFVVYSVSTITLFIYLLFDKSSFVPASNNDWIWFILLAVLPNLLGHTLFNWSLKYVSTNAISIAILFEPVGAAILAYLIFHEVLHVTQIVGGSIILLGILFFVVDDRVVKKIFSKKA